MVLSNESAARVLERFDRDGSLRDIYVFDTNVEHWVRMATHLVDRGYDCEIRVGDSAIIDATRLRDVFESPERRGAILVKIAEAEIYSHLFTSQEIEFDLDPAQWSRGNLNALVEFTRSLAEATSRNVFVTHENTPESCIFVFPNGAEDILLPVRPTRRTSFGHDIASRLSAILTPFSYTPQNRFEEVPTTVAAQQAAKAWAAMDRPNDLAWHTALTSNEFRQLRELSIAFWLFFGPTAPSELCEISGFKISALRRQFWETLQKTRALFHLSP